MKSYNHILYIVDWGLVGGEVSPVKEFMLIRCSVERVKACTSQTNASPSTTWTAMLKGTLEGLGILLHCSET